MEVAERVTMCTKQRFNRSAEFTRDCERDSDPGMVSIRFDRAQRLTRNSGALGQIGLAEFARDTGGADRMLAIGHGACLARKYHGICHRVSRGTQKMRRVSWKIRLALMAIVALAISAGWAREAGADEISVAAAADLTFAFKDIAAKFQAQTGTQVKLSLGSSGNFFSQIQNGAPYDLFFSADMGYATKLEGAGLTEPGSLTEYAIGRIVLWTPNSSKVDVNSGLAVLKDPSIRKIAIANPEHAPYGRAAVAALKH